SSGFRSYACNSAVGGASNSRHLYGDAADLVGTPSLCTLARQARAHGFSEILGPGYPGHNDHTHVAFDPSAYWSAPTCGLGPERGVRPTARPGKSRPRSPGAAGTPSGAP